MCKKILILDDDYSFACDLINNNSKADVSFAVADSLNRARMMVKSDSYDVILANTKVPGGNSYTLKDEIHSISPQTGMIFMSAMDDEFDKIKSLGERCVKKNDLYNSKVDFF